MNHKKGYFFKATLILFSIIISAFICSYIYIGNMSSILNNNIKERLQEVAEQTRNSLNVKFSSAIKELENLSNIISLQSEADIEKIIKLLNEYERGSSFYRIGIILPDGRGYSNEINGTNFSDREYFQKAIKGESNISNFMNDRTSGILDSTFAVPVYGKEKNIIAVLAAAKPISEFENLLDISIFNDKGFLTMANSEGTILVKQNHQNYNYNVENLDELSLEDGITWRNVIEKSDEGILKTSLIDKEEQYIAYISVEVNDWYILSVVSSNIIDKNIYSLIRSSVYMWICLAVIFLIIIGYIIRSKEKTRRQLEYIAFSDKITGGTNYNAFVLEFNEKMKKEGKENYALVMIDIDKFKIINDVFGYEKGNKTLKYLADTFKKHLKETEIFSRINADNFLILLEYKSDEDILNRMENILKSMDGIIEDVNSRVYSYKLILTYGVCRIKDKNESLDILSDRANLAKRTVKGSHKSTGAFYTKGLSDKIFKEKELENCMDIALEEKQFHVYFQPELSFETGKIIGAEALVRWIHPEKGMIFPDEFIPLFEKNHFIKKLDFYMINEVASIIEKWKEEDNIYLPDTISVNLSRVHLMDLDLPEKLVSIIKRHNVKASRIGIELTESAFFEDEELLVVMMERLKNAGFKIFIDDFGSGYSSLNTLKNLKVDYLKFDRGFLTNLEENKRGQDILHNLVNMAKDINLRTVAEGVETVTQAKFLKEKGFDIAQGYYYYKPMPAEDIIEKLKVNRDNEE